MLGEIVRYFGLPWYMYALVYILLLMLCIVLIKNKHDKSNNKRAVRNSIFLMALFSFIFFVIGIKVMDRGILIKNNIYKSANVPTNRGNFDMRKYKLSTTLLWEDGNKEEWKVENIDCIKKIRNHFSNVVEKNCPKSSKGIYKALLLGEKDDIDEKEMTILKVCGLSHIFAISGLHISILGYGLYKVLRKRFLILSSAMCSGLLIIFYGLMIGFTVSTLRAVIMFEICMGAEVLGRTYDRINSIVCAAIVVGIVYPFGFISFSYQMSFMATIVCNFALDIILEFLKTDGMVRKLIFSTMSINMILLLLVADNYYEVPVFASLCNMIIILLIPFVIGLGFIGLLLFKISFVSRGAFYLGSVLCNLGDVFLRKIYHLPYSSIICGKMKIWQIVLCIGVIIVYIIICKCFLIKRENIKIDTRDFNDYKDKKNVRYLKEITFAGVYFIIYFIISFYGFYNGNSNKALYMADVGQGDFIYIRTDDGINVTIDGGSSNISDVAKYRMVSFLKYKAVGRIDYAFISHGDMDHYNGIVDIMQNKDTYGITVENIVISKTKDINDGIKEIINTAYENEVNIIYINKGERLGDFTCLWPGKDVDYESENGKSQVLSYDLNNGKTRILFMGDYDGDEDVIVENMYKYTGSAKCDILKVAHHGSKYGTSNNFLKSIEPEIAIISCSKYNNYGHPSPEVIERLKKNGCETYITKDLGEIEILLKE